MLMLLLSRKLSIYLRQNRVKSRPWGLEARDRLCGTNKATLVIPLLNSACFTIDLTMRFCQLERYLSSIDIVLMSIRYYGFPGFPEIKLLPY